MVASRLVSLVVVLLSSCGVAIAQEPLRWKFEDGQNLQYAMHQQMTNEVQVGPANNIKTTVDQDFTMLWKVVDVTDEGNATIEQKFDRIQMKMALPQGQGFTYDSESKDPPQGMAAMIAPMFEAMQQGTITITMSPRGEVLEAKIPDEFVQALQKAPGAQMMGDLANAEGLKRMAEQASLTFPEEALKVDETMTAKVELKNPMLGKQIVETTYTYKGPKDVDGETYEVFAPELKMSFEPLADDEKAAAPAAGTPAASAAKITDQSSAGEVLFSRELGRLVSSHMDQDFTIAMTVNGQALTTKVDQQIDIKVTPVDAESENPSEEAAAPAN